MRGVVHVEVDEHCAWDKHCPGRSAMDAQIFWLIENSLLKEKGSDTWPELVSPQINCFHHTVLWRGREDTHFQCYFSSLLTDFVEPLRGKNETFKKSLATMDKQHRRGYRKKRTEMKKKAAEEQKLHRKLMKQELVGGALEACRRQVLSRLWFCQDLTFENS